MPTEQQLQILEKFKAEHTLKTLNLNGFGLTEEHVYIVSSIIKANPLLENITLSDNDFRESIVTIFGAIVNLKHIKTLDIVDNNIEQTSTWEALALLIELNHSLSRVYAGAKRILGSSNARHVITIKSERGISTEQGFYETGFNEIVRGGIIKLNEALKFRITAGTPLVEFYLISAERTCTEISAIGNTFYFFSMKQRKYTADTYRTDNDSGEIELRPSLVNGQ
jgi:hypothetical protein